MAVELPPGPRLPSVIQTIAWWNRTIPLLERCRARYGSITLSPRAGARTVLRVRQPARVAAAA